MLRKLLKRLTHNVGLKILALLFAVAMWMAVVNLDDPSINKVFTVAVTVENESYIAAMNKYYELDPDASNVTFNVFGKRSFIDDLSSSDFKATADMSQLIQGENENDNVVPVEITALRHASQLTISKRTQKIKVNLEQLMSQPYVIEAGTQGKPAEGYTLGDMDVTPNLLRVSGPEAVVSQIKTVKASIDISGMSTEITDRAIPVLLDEEGETIDPTRLTLNLNIVTVRVDILPEKEVPVKVNYSGTPAHGFEVIAVNTEPEMITIKGKSDVLNAISEITIPEDVITVDGVEEKFKQQVDITQYLPEGVSLSNSAQGSITVHVDVEELERRKFSVPSEAIDVDNLPEGYRIEFSSRKADIIIYGLNQDLDALHTEDLHPILDVAGMAAGSHVGRLQLTLDKKYIVGDATVSYTIYTGADTDTDDGTDTDDKTQADDDTSNIDDTGSQDGDDNSVSDTDADDARELEE